MYRIDCTTQAIVRVRTRRQYHILNPIVKPAYHMNH
jgi:hypothetical protein